MLGYFEAVNQDGKTLGFYKYSTVSEQLKKTLYQMQVEQGVRFFCLCQSERKIEMKISRDFKVYPANYGIGDLHSEYCPKRIREQEPKLWEIRHDEDTKLYYHFASPYATAADFAKKLNDLTFYRLTHPEMRLPNNMLDFNKKIYVTQKYIKTFEGKTLFDMCISNYKKISELPANKEYFFYGTLTSVRTTDFSKDVLYIDCKDTIGKKYRFYLEKEVFLELFNSSPKLTWAICGFIYKKVEKSTILTFSDCYLATIDKVGIFY